MSGGYHLTKTYHFRPKYNIRVQSLLWQRPLKGAIRRILKMAFDMLGSVIALQGLAICPTGLEPPVGARNRRKATVKIRSNVH